MSKEERRLSEQIRDLLAGKDPKETAEALGIKVNDYYRKRSCKRPWSKADYFQLERVLGVELNYTKRRLR